MRGAWIEIAASESPGVGKDRRSPCGERGLKSAGCHPALVRRGRSPCGERGLKCVPAAAFAAFRRRSPCGERGLKYCSLISELVSALSLPVRGAWIEIFRAHSPA